MIITLIGMSGIGKTFWSKKLEKIGYTRFGCDEMIEEHLAPELATHGYAGIHDVARWMGHPYDEQYPETSKKYVGYEQSVVERICDAIEAEPARKTVVDTTGSIVYLAPETIERLRKISTVVYLAATLEYADQLYQRFLQDPKPIIWGNSFNRRFFERPERALARCYPELLDYRTKRYSAMANITIDYETHNSFELDEGELLNHIQTKG